MRLRRAFAVVLCLLLLSLQGQVLVHPLSHIGNGKPQETGLASPVSDAPCLQCALLAGGSSSVAADTTALPAPGIVDVVAALEVSQPASGAPAWFQSRAPPHLV